MQKILPWITISVIRNSLFTWMLLLSAEPSLQCQHFAFRPLHKLLSDLSTSEIHSQDCILSMELHLSPELHWILLFSEIIYYVRTDRVLSICFRSFIPGYLILLRINWPLEKQMEIRLPQENLSSTTSCLPSAICFD